MIAFLLMLILGMPTTVECQSGCKNDYCTHYDACGDNCKCVTTECGLPLIQCLGVCKLK